MRARSYDVAFYLPTLGPLIDSDAAVPFAGGAETQIWLLARGLARRGYAPCVITADTPRGLPERMDDVDVVVRPDWEGGRGLRGQIDQLWTLWCTLSPLRAITVQRAAGFSTGLVGAITRARGRTFVYSSANIIDFEYERLASSRRHLWLFHLGVRLANLIVVQTNEQAQRCRVRFGRDAVMIRSIAEPAAKAAGSPDVFLWVGRLVRYKQPQEFLSLARALPEARFQMVGLGSGDDAQMEQMVKSEARGLPNLELLTTRPRAELFPLYERAVAVVNTGAWEGMPNTFLEGWARGVPALAFAHDPDGVITSDRLGGFAAGSPERLVSLAQEMWASRNDRSDLEQRCRDYVQREHDGERVIDRWIEALDLRRKVTPAVERQILDDSVYARS